MDGGGAARGVVVRLPAGALLMLLRTRITLMVSLIALALVFALIAEGDWRERSVRAEMDRARVQGQASAWVALARNALQPAKTLADAVARSGALTAALTAGDHAETLAIVKSLQGEAGGAVAVAAVEIATAAGVPVAGGGEGGAVLSAAAVAAAGRRGGPIAGLLFTASGAPVLAALAPLYSRSGLVGAVAVSIDPQSTIKQLAAAIGADAALSDAAGAVAVASAERLPSNRLVAASGSAMAGVATIIDAGRRLQVTWNTIPAIVDGRSAILLGVKDVSAFERQRFWLSTISLIGVLSASALFLAFLHWYMRRSFHPLHRVIQMLNALARGERTAAPYQPTRDDEIGRLAATATDFRAGLDARDQLLKLRQDLEAAHNIQASILPEDPPERPDFAVRTFMRAARDVGGDFFDFFDLPDGRFGFVIADVSGKGMGAALFMAAACTVIRTTARLVADPGECLARANDLLAANNAASMFVTVFYGVLRPETGTVVYANGGHNPPYRISPDGRISALPGTKGKLLALFPGRAYATAELTLAPGECLYLFTDGVTEAQDAAGALFGEGRLMRALAEAERAPGTLLDHVLDRVTRFVADAPQADDITCLALRWHGPASEEAPAPSALALRKEQIHA